MLLEEEGQGTRYKVPAEGAAPLEGGQIRVNIAKAANCAGARIQGQRGSRIGAPAPRVCHEPSGAMYFSPGVVRAIA